MFCPICDSDLKSNHFLEDTIISSMKNRSRIIHPKCSVCGHTIQISNVENNITENQKVLLITGTAGSGKTAIGQLIEKKSDYIFIDGDAISKRVNYFARMDSSIKADEQLFQTETIHTMLIVLALGYNVAVGYVINKENLERYRGALSKYNIIPTFRVLVPERKICIERDIARECWTAGEVWIDKWYEEQRAFLTTHHSFCIDSSNETLEETFNYHFAHLL